MKPQSESEFEQLLMILADYHSNPDSAAERSALLEKLFPWQRNSDEPREVPAPNPAAELPIYSPAENMKQGSASGGYVATA